jgi:hypothetical protein
MAVVVVIAHRAAHKLPLHGEPGVATHIAKAPTSLVVKQAHAPADEHDVEKAVPVVVNERRAAAGGLQDIQR